MWFGALMIRVIHCSFHQAFETGHITLGDRLYLKAIICHQKAHEGMAPISQMRILACSWWLVSLAVCLSIVFFNSGINHLVYKMSENCGKLQCQFPRAKKGPEHFHAHKEDFGTCWLRSVQCAREIWIWFYFWKVSRNMREEDKLMDNAWEKKRGSSSTRIKSHSGPGPARLPTCPLKCYVNSD